MPNINPNHSNGNNFCVCMVLKDLLGEVIAKKVSKKNAIDTKPSNFYSRSVTIYKDESGHTVGPGKISSRMLQLLSPVNAKQIYI